MVRIAQAEPTMQRGDLGKESTQARRFRPGNFARVRIYKIHIAIGRLYLDRGMRVLMGSHHLDGRRKGGRSERCQRVERLSRGLLLTRIYAVAVLIRRTQDRPLIGQQCAGDGKVKYKDADQHAR